MIGLLRTLLLFAVVATAADVAPAQQWYPIPDFTTYKIPETVQTPAPSAGWEYLDLSLLVIALALSSYFALVTRSRRGLFLLTVASVAWFGFWREGCICSIGAIQNVTLAVFDRTYVVPMVAVAFFALPLIFTLFFGRTFCAAVCPLGAIQELVALRPVKVPAWLDHTLGLLAYVYLGLAVLFAATGTAFVICRYDPFIGLFRLSAGVNMLILGGCFLVVGLFVGRPYCRYLCPYGAILGLLSKVSKWHLAIPPNECVQCRLCEDMCPYGAIREPTVVQKPEVRRAGRRRLALLLLLVPALVALGLYLGLQLRVPLSRLHPEVQLSEQVWAEDALAARRPLTEADTTDASVAFRRSGRSADDLHRSAVQRRGDFAIGGACFGAWVGLVLGVKLIHLSVRRRRTDYQPDRAGCVSCGRCFWYCPNEQARLGLIRSTTRTAGQSGQGDQ